MLFDLYVQHIIYLISYAVAGECLVCRHLLTKSGLDWRLDTHKTHTTTLHREASDVHDGLLDFGDVLATDQSKG